MQPGALHWREEDRHTARGSLRRASRHTWCRARARLELPLGQATRRTRSRAAKILRRHEPDTEWSAQTDELSLAPHADLRALAATHAYRLLDAKRRPAALATIRDALRENPWCEPAWMALVDACANGTSTPDDARKLFDEMLRLTADYPSLQVTSFSRLLPTEGETRPIPMTGWSPWIDRAAKAATSTDRPDLEREFLLLKGVALERTGDATGASAHFRDLVKRFAGADMPRFQRALRVVMRDLNGDANRDERIRYIAKMSDELHYLSKTDRKAGRVSAFYLQFRRLMYEDRVSNGDQRGANAIRLRIMLETRRPEEQEETRGPPGLVWTATLGTAAGDPIPDISKRGALIGCRFSTVRWSAEDVLRSFQPLFRTRDGVQAGETFGTPSGDVVEVLAPEGYAVGVFAAQGRARVNGFQFVFMRVGERGRLDPSDSIFSEWQAHFNPGAVLSVGGGGRPIRGVRGFVEDDHLRGLGIAVTAK